MSWRIFCWATGSACKSIGPQSPAVQTFTSHNITQGSSDDLGRLDPLRHGLRSGWMEFFRSSPPITTQVSLHHCNARQRGSLKANETIKFDSDEIPKTILKEWHINSSFQLVLNSASGNTAIINPIPPCKAFDGQFELTGNLMTKWKRAISGNVTSRRRLGDDQPLLSSRVHIERSFEFNGKRFTS